MKVLAINGSPNKQGNTYYALNMVGERLQDKGIDFEILHIGNKAIRGCLACGKCAQQRNERCSIVTDSVNEWIQSIKYADGVLLGGPVHFSGMPGTMKSFLDRAFYVAGVNGSLFRHKVGASVVAVRRSGGSATFDSLNHYLSYAEMILPSSNYWNIIHGAAPGEANMDTEGTQIMEVLGNNMAWLLKMKEQSLNSVPVPDTVRKIKYNYIR